MTERFDGLSHDARRRAEAMLPSLTGELRRSVRRRAARKRAATAAFAFALLATGVLVATLSVRSTPLAAPSPEGTVVVAPPPEAAPSLIEIVRTNDAPMIEVIRGAPDGAALASVYATTRVDLASILVNDTELLDLLDSIGRPTGLVRAGGRVWLTAAVTDEEIARERGEIGGGM